MTCPLFVELCAGTAALSLRLHRRYARPPVSRMGAKTGYADALLRVLGLRPGQGAAHYLWCEPDPGVRLLLEAYRDPGLAQEAASIIRGWADEEPRALWERLRAEGPPRGVDAGDVGVPPREVARIIQILCSNELINVAWSDAHQAWRNTGAGGTTFGGSIGYGADRAPAKLDALPLMPATITPDARRVDPREVARWLNIAGWSQKGSIAAGYYAGPDRGGACGSHPEGWVGSITSEGLASRADTLPTLPATITPDARRVDPREVARWGLLGEWAFRRGEPASGPAGDSRWLDGPWRDRSGAIVGKRVGTTATSVGRRYEHVPALPATITPDARGIEPGPDLPPGTVAYMDPPYLGTTGYGHDLPRSEVVALARRWAAAGATVAISEAEPIADLTAEGWRAVRIDGERMGQKRTFSKQQAEWLTLSRPPAWTPSEQRGLFG